jgi:hypothetical protein
VNSRRTLGLAAPRASTSCVPQIRGTGDLVAGNPLTRSLTNGNASSLVSFVLATTAVWVPFKGGVPGPSPDVILAFGRDTEGVWSATVPWIAGIPTGTNIWFQSWP